MKDTQSFADTSTLNLQGSKIQLESIFKRKILRPEKHNLSKPTTVKQVNKQKQSGAPKKECKLKINRIDNVEVCNEQLKKIHETKQVRELGRLLELHTSNVHNAEEFELFNCDLTKYVNIYEDLFNKYYKELKEWDAFDEEL